MALTSVGHQPRQAKASHLVVNRSYIAVYKYAFHNGVSSDNSEGKMGDSLTSDILGESDEATIAARTFVASLMAHVRPLVTERKYISQLTLV